MKKLKSIVKKLPKPENLNIIKIIKPNKIPFDLMARLKCFQCGLFSRAILCPPYLFQTYPQFETEESSIDFVNEFDRAVVFIWQNDGTKSWKLNKKSLAHINFKKKIGMELKGTEASQSREIGKLTKSYMGMLNKKGFETFGMINGHCDLCGFKCPRRDNPPCTHGGLPSLEAIGIEVHKLLDELDVYYEYPVKNLLTAVTLILVR